MSIKAWGKPILVIFALLCLISACGLNLVPSKDPWYAMHYIIMHEFEWEAYKELSPQGKAQFQEIFWKYRYPDAQETFSTRLDYVTEEFKKEKVNQPWTTDRARIYLLNGRPAEVRYVENTNLGGIEVMSGAEQERLDQGGRNVDRSKEDLAGRQSEVWVYPFQNTIVTYRFDFTLPRSWKLNSGISESPYLQELERASREQTYMITDVEKYRAELEELKKIE